MVSFPQKLAPSLRFSFKMRNVLLMLVASFCHLLACTVSVNNDAYSVMEESTVTYSRSKIFTSRGFLECVTKCSSDDSCSAVVVDKVWNERSSYCEILVLDIGVELKTKPIANSQQIWIKQEKETTGITGDSCPSSFNFTEVGCFLVEETATTTWSEAEYFCQLYGPNVYLAETDTIQVGTC